jgi:hypothetical protein
LSPSGQRQCRTPGNEDANPGTDASKGGQRAAAAVKTWLVVQIEKKRAAQAADTGETAPDEQFAPERLAA